MKRKIDIIQIASLAVSYRQLNRWITMLSIMPCLYLFGWLIAQILFVSGIGLEKSDLSLLGTVITFFAFLALMPKWIKLRWQNISPWNALGLKSTFKKSSYIFFIRGLVLSFMLIFAVIIFAFLGSWLVWQNNLTFHNFINALFLGIGVGFAEELIFRGWLWGELHLLIGYRWSIVSQAAIFSLVHARLNMDIWESIGLFSGLFLLGLLLAFRRILDHGHLWGCIGLHGGFVGGWFFVTSGMVEFSLDAPSWIFGPGGFSPNPIGGFLAILFFVCLLLHQLTAFAMAGAPITGARKASSKGATP